MDWPQTERQGPLAGLRVLELTHIVSGPSAGVVLADLGADSIKIEATSGGDVNRGSGFSFLNRNKRSLSLDLKSREGKEIFLKLVASADIALDNFAPGAVDRLGLSYDVLAAINPRLIYLGIRGFLPGPNENRPFLDELAQMMGGLAFMTGDRGAPRRAGASIVDIGAATYGVLAILVALYERERTGLGQKLSSALYETVVYWEATQMASAAATGVESRPFAELAQGPRFGWAVYNLFDTSDNLQVFIGITSDGHWRRFCEAFGFPELLADPRLGSNKERVDHRQWLVALLREDLVQYSSKELQEKLNEADVPFAVVRRPDELAADEHLLASGQLVDTPMPGVGMAKLPRLPYRSSAYQTTVFRPAPGRGEHTREILLDLGYSEEELERLAAEGKIILGAPVGPEDAPAPVV